MSKADNKELEKSIKTMEHWIEYEKENKEKINNANELIEIQETVLKELKRLQEKNKELKQANREKADKLIEITDLYMKSIQKDKIREKIEELKKEKEELENKTFLRIIDYINEKEKIDNQIKILKELLEGK